MLSVMHVTFYNYLQWILNGTGMKSPALQAGCKWNTPLDQDRCFLWSSPSAIAAAWGGGLVSSRSNGGIFVVTCKIIITQQENSYVQTQNTPPPLSPFLFSQNISIFLFQNNPLTESIIINDTRQRQRKSAILHRDIEKKESSLVFE